MRKRHQLLGLLVALGLSSGAVAAVSAAQAARLGTSLTPFGAQVEGNGKAVASGLGIPAWTGGLTTNKIPDSYKGPGNYHPSPFPNDKVLFRIDAANMGQYADKLTPGVKALLKAWPDSLYLNVYRSRRTASAPSWVYDNTKTNAQNAKLVAGGNGVEGAFGGIPFPIPTGTNQQRAQQVIWNHILRWHGVYIVRRGAEAAVAPDGSYTPIVTQQEVYYKYYDRKYSATTLDNTLFYYLSFTKSPARLAGGAILIRETLNQEKEARQAWGYNVGLRRVRRSPNIAYDMPVPESSGLRTADETDMYNGSPKKYQWRLVYDHPVERFVPYNSYKLNSGSLTYDQILKPGHIASNLQRWELHRVWVVEGTLRKGERHIYHKRRFFVDADSWQIIETDEYDDKDKLWRVGLAYVMNYYEVPTQWAVLQVHMDLRSKRYDVVNLENENGHDQDFSQPVPNPRHFHPSSLSRRGR